MCTVSVLRAAFDDSPAPEGLLWRVAFNRDEQLTRGTALAPVYGSYGGIDAVHPVDPDGRGTWIAATSAGLVFALLNETEAARQPESPISRGLVIPALLSCGSLGEVEARLSCLPFGRHRPYRLLVIADSGVLEAVEAGARRLWRHDADPRLVRTSSSVEPSVTRSRRTALFEQMVPNPSVSAQDAYHRHRWPDNPESSVLMSRPDAATVSLTVVEAFADGFRLAYRPWPAGARGVTDLPRAA